MRKKLKQIFEAALCGISILLLLSITYYIGDSLMPERNNYGSTWKAYLQEPEDSIDVLFLGSSRAYCDIIPAEIFRQTGITSYVMAGPEQTASLTYYYLRECLKTQTPKCVFVEVSSAFYSKYEHYSLANVCYMPFSANKIMAAFECEDGILSKTLFPISEFHYRIFENQSETSSECNLNDGIMLAGYTYLSDYNSDIIPSEITPNTQVNTEQYADNIEWFGKISKLCCEKDIKLYFYISPSLTQVEKSQRDRLLQDLLKFDSNSVNDYSDLYKEIGIDSTTEWYDGLHFNFSGAIKYSDFIAEQLIDIIQPSSDGIDAKLWKNRINYIDKLANAYND